jgi:2OG-Fe(II) oxygenase superfamily/WD domain, G-beta repeat
MNAKIEVQNLLPNAEYVCFVIPSLFSQSECEALLSSEVKQSFQSAISNYPVYYRNNDRLVIDDENLSKRLFDKVKPYLPETITTESDVQTENGFWTLSQLNSRLRFCKYSANQYFHRHLDGIHYRSEKEQSKLTFMIYLNSATAFKGGNTLFYKTKETQEVWATYTPKQGDLIVFDHNVWHEGAVLEEGEKFVLRSDILYTKQTETYTKQPFGGHLGYIWQLLKFDNTTILSGGRDKVINIWNSEGELIQSLQGHKNSILCIEKLDERHFITGSREKKIIIWRENEFQVFEQVQGIEVHAALVLSLCRLTNELFVSSSGDNTIKICNLSGQVLKNLIGHTNWVWQVIKISDSIIASCSEDKTIKIWNTGFDNALETIDTASPTFSLAYNDALRQLIGGDLNGIISIRTLTSDFKVAENIEIKAHNGIIRTLKILSNEYFASGGEDNKVNIWNTKTQACIFTYAHQNFVQSLELVGDNILLSAAYDGTIKRINLNEIF